MSDVVKGEGKGEGEGGKGKGDVDKGQTDRHIRQ